jgi:hypothetical protein
VIEVMNRETVRDAIVAGLTPAMTLAQLVVGHQKANVGSQWPAVLVFTAGSERPQVTEQGIRSRFHYVAQLWVLYYDKEGGWTEADAEDALDALEQQFTAWMANNQVNEVWTTLMFDGRSRVGVTAPGESYLVEEIPIVAEVHQ